MMEGCEHKWMDKCIRREKDMSRHVFPQHHTSITSIHHTQCDEAIRSTLRALVSCAAASPHTRSNQRHCRRQSKCLRQSLLSHRNNTPAASAPAAPRLAT